MLWFVKIDGRIMGTVIAPTEADAMLAAEQKFGVGWDSVMYVLPRKA